MKIKGWDLAFFNSGEWQVCDERLKDIEKINHRIVQDGYVPGRNKLFSALRATSRDEVRCAIITQDPYPNREFSTGLALSVPGTVQVAHYPKGLQTFLDEYSSDLHLPIPHSGNLDKWCERGVLLWNAIPSCGTNRSLSHDWTEWSYLTKEIIHVLSQKGIVFALLGQVARRFESGIDLRNNSVICTAHPATRGVSKSPFVGSRLFSTINAKLVSNGQEAIDWRLP